MKILMLVGSYRKNGNTDQVCGLIKSHLENIAARHSLPLEIETIHLGQQQIGPCRGCRVCFDRGEDRCPIKDDLPAIKAKMQAADGILIASPIYVDDVNGITKNWIDRLAHVCHRPEFAGKIAFSIVTVGSSPFSHSLGTLNMALRTWGFHVAGQAGFKTGALMTPAAMQALHDKKARQAAQTFFRSLQTQAFARPSFMALLIFKIQQLAWQRSGSDPNTIDYQYWQRKGWMKPSQKFHIPIRSSPIKVSLARLAGAAIARFVS